MNPRFAMRSTGVRVVAVAAAVALLAPLARAGGPSLKIFYTASVKGYIDHCGCRYNPTGGIERRATYLKENAPTGMPELILDGGDLLGETDSVSRMQTTYLFRAMQMMGYHTIGVGPREFMYGMPYLHEAESQYGFTFTSANVIDDATGKPLFAPYVIEDLHTTSHFGHSNTIRVGVVSVMGTDRPPLSTPSDPTVRIIDPVRAVHEMVDSLRNKTDLLVVLAYTEQAELDSISAMPGVDVTLSCRPLRIPPEWVTFSNGHVLGYSTFQGRGVGWVDVTLDGAHHITHAKGDLAFLTSDIKNDAAMMTLKKEFADWKARENASEN